MEAIAASSEADAVRAGVRVLLVAPPAAGGLANHVISLMRDLRAADHDVGVACEPEGRIAEAALALELPTFGIICSALGGHLPTAVRAARLIQCVTQFRPRIVHTHSFGATGIGTLACTVVRSPILLVTIHNYPPDTTGMSPREAGQRWALGLAVQRASRIIAVSEALQRDLLLAHPEAAGKCLTIHNGVDTRTAPARTREEICDTLGVREDAPLVGMLARLAPQKGIEDFIRAAAIVATSYPATNFVLAGDGPLMASAVQLREELRLDGRFSLPGHVECGRDLTAAVDVLVVASTSEGSSVAAMEAMSLGKPVVATAVGGVPEVVVDGETGILVEPGHPEMLAKGIGELLREPTRAREMGEQGRRRAAGQFDILDMLARTRAVYADVVREQAEAGKR
jgi:glycosyltransferase involved in cell wall biosynthesis